MKYLRIITLFFSFLFLNAKGQTNECRLLINFNSNFDSDYDNDYNNNSFDFNKHKLCLNLYISDSLIAKKCIANRSSTKFSNLPRGKYDLVIFVDDVKEVTYHSIDVDTIANSSLRVSLKNFSYKRSNKTEDSAFQKVSNIEGFRETGYGIINILKGIPLNNTKTIFDAEFQASMTRAYVLVRKKYFNIPLEFGFSGGFSHIKRDTTLFNVKPKNKERYGYFNCTVAMLNSFNLFYDSLSSYPKCIFQYGIGYNFPIVYNHTGIEGDSKIMDRSISNYNNVFVIGRLMFGRESKFGVQAEYNLTSFLKTGYSAPSIFRIGLTVKTE